MTRDYDAEYEWKDKRDMIKYPQTTQDEDWSNLSKNGINAASVEEWDGVPESIEERQRRIIIGNVNEENGIFYKDPLTTVKDTQVVSTGGSTSYYELPERAKELQDLIEHKKMNYAIANIFKACYRLGQKEGNDDMYDLKKIQWFVEREIRRQE